MLFSSLPFLYGFLPLTLAVYFAVPRRAKNAVLLTASLIFYFYGEGLYTALLVFSSLSDWLHSLYIEKHRGERRAKAALLSSVAVNLAMLGFFKYTDFLLGTANDLFGLRLSLLHVPLPLGISFFTFQTMSYTIDVYRGRVHAERNLVTLATFVCLFPQLVAGPIVRYADIAPELRERSASLSDLAEGARRFTVGLGKKVLLADSMGALVAAFRDSPDKSVGFFWLYALAFTLQIYLDFSGYSDMAIGLGRMLGFTFPENFDYPYLSRSVTEFWRRWHMTLGGWFRDYVYIPLGGNRVSRGKWLRNIAAVWLLTGLWHGASWNFVLWGGLYGLLLAAEKLWPGPRRKLPALSRVYVLLVTVLGFVIFNADGLAGAAADLGGLFGLTGLPLWSGGAAYALRSYALPLLLAALGSTPLLRNTLRRLAAAPGGERALAVLEPVGVAAVLLLATAALVDGSFSPFLYFRF